MKNKMKQLIECVPNFSEGRDPEKIEAIVQPFRGREAVKLLDTQRDEDHNRLVVTVVGEPEALKSALLAAMAAAVAVIDLSTAASTRAWGRWTWCPSSPCGA